MTRDELLRALAVERQDQTWWTTKPAMPPEMDDSELATARRRRALMEACGDAEEKTG